jgi:predicted lipid-binding transport protein (Tim44 family)
VRQVLLSMVIGLIGLGFTAADVEAKRLGGGMSQGVKRPPPAQRQAPDNPPQQATPQQQAAAPATAGAAAAAAAPAKRSWLGPIAGLAAGLGIAALMSHLGFGETFANILTLMLVALLAVWAVRFLLRRFGPRASQAQGMQYAGAGVGNGPAAAPRAAADGAMFRSTSQSLGTDVQPRAVPAPTQSQPALPPGFDHAAFERAAKMIFVRMQAANDRGDVEDLREFSTPEMFAAFRVDLQDRGDRGQRTDVVQLDADVVDWAADAGRQIVSVRFHGLIREEDDGGAAPFDEVWHLVRPEDGSRSWAIAGIQQVA